MCKICCVTFSVVIKVFFQFLLGALGFLPSKRSDVTQPPFEARQAASDCTVVLEEKNNMSEVTPAGLAFWCDINKSLLVHCMQARLMTVYGGLSFGNKCISCGPALQGHTLKRPPPVNIKEAELALLPCVRLCYPLGVMNRPEAQTTALGSRSCQSMKTPRCRLFWALLCALVWQCQLDT